MTEDTLTYEIKIQLVTGKRLTFHETAYHCTNPDCDCETILRSYCFCPMCGFPISWDDGTDELDDPEGDDDE